MQSIAKQIFLMIKKNLWKPAILRIKYVQEGEPQSRSTSSVPPTVFITVAHDEPSPPSLSVSLTDPYDLSSSFGFVLLNCSKSASKSECLNI